MHANGPRKDNPPGLARSPSFSHTKSKKFSSPDLFLSQAGQSSKNSSISTDQVTVRQGLLHAALLATGAYTAGIWSRLHSSESASFTDRRWYEGGVNLEVEFNAYICCYEDSTRHLGSKLHQPYGLGH